MKGIMEIKTHICGYHNEALTSTPSLRAFLRTVKFRCKYLVTKQRLNRQILAYKNANRVDKRCPVCGYCECVEVYFYFEEVEIKKYLCLSCNHLFSLWLQTDLHKAQELFDYDKENIWKNEQWYLLRKMVKFCGREGKYLDFGVGGNISVINNLNKEMPSNIFYACDINERKETNYFKTYDDKMLGEFDGITSSNVVEHLDNTIEAWKYFNRLLKPIKDSNQSVMFHSFPSLLHYDLSHWGIKIQSHLCLFSEKSLMIVCNLTGFEFITWKWKGSFRFPIFYFKKVRDV